MTVQPMPDELVRAFDSACTGLIAADSIVAPADPQDAQRQARGSAEDLPALRALASLRLKSGDCEGAQLLLSRLCAITPQDADCWFALAFALTLTTDFTAAMLACERAIDAAPSRYDIGRHYVDCAVAANALPATLAEMDRRLAEDPADATALYRRALLLMHCDRHDEAVDSAEVAALLAPADVDPLKLLGQLLVRSLHTGRAVEVTGRALALAPDDWDLGNEHAVAYARAYRFAESCERLEELIRRFGPKPRLLCNLANARVALGDQKGAEAAAQAAIAVDPACKDGQQMLLNAMPYRPGITGAELLAQASRLSRLLAPEIQVPFTNTPDPHRPLRIGLLSGMLKVHPVGWLTLAGLEALDPRRFKLVSFAQLTASDWIAQRYQAISEWHRTAALDNEALMRHVRAASIDVLIDLGGYGDHGRMEACSQRLAPVQIKWVGSQAYSTGIAAMDWFVTDRWETPPHLAAHYSERLLRLPDGYVCYSPPPDAPDVGPLPARVCGHVTFGCFNNLAKVNRTLIAAWAEILRRAPDARLLLRTHGFDDPGTADRVAATFLRAGIDLARVELKGSAKHRILLADYNRVDIVLDPFPYSGGLTTCEALYMGVPVLTLPGETFASRHAYSHISNIGLAEDWAARDLEDYIARAVSHAADLARLEQVRAALRSRMRASPLCDGPRFAEGLGTALRHAWCDWCERQTRRVVPGSQGVSPFQAS